MDCPTCSHPNRPDARFCEACGTVLELTCVACGAHVRAEARFCDTCGTPTGESRRGEPVPAPRRAGSALPDHLVRKVRAAGPSLTGERKQVTVLFADVMDSMQLAEQTDPEEWRGIIERFFAILCEGVHRYEGTVDKFTGDGAMALFGAPIAHEDHAARACNAALHLTDELATFAAGLRREDGINFLVRIGLNSGEVVVGAIGEDLEMDYTAVGHTVGLAQRMESLAEPGKAYITEHTAALVEGYFDLRDLGEFEVKGAHEPLRVYELAGLGTLRTRFDVSRAHGLSRFVGREEETAALEAALTHANEGNAQVVCVVGEAGVGKSRLCYEFAQTCRNRGIDVWEGHCKARGETLPLMPLLELLRAYFGIGERDAGRAAREKITGRAVLLDESLKDELPLLFDLLGVSDPERPAPRIDPEARQRRLFATLNRLLTARSERSETAVYLIEDLHWIDPASEAFLENLIDTLPGTRTLVIVNLRPGYQAGWMGHSYCARLALAPLGPEDGRELLGALLGTDPSLDGLAERIQERTAGNPFFIEELVQGLAEGGSLAGERGSYRMARPIDVETIPATVQSVIAARIDRLGEREKQLLETAAVVGREFSEPLLRRVAGLPEPELRAALRGLLDGEMIYERQLVPEPEFRFRHQLIEEVAYHAQLGEARARLHAAVARAIEELNPERLDELAAPISRHLEQAGDKPGAAGWGARAAAWAGYNDPAEAARHLRKVRELTADAEDEETAVLGITARAMLLQLAWRLGAGHREMADHRRELEELLAEGEALATRCEQPVLRAILLGAYAAALATTGFTPDLIGIYERAMELAAQAGDRGVQLVTAGTMTYALWFSGRTADALATVESAIALAQGDRSLGQGLGLISPLSFALMIRGALLIVMGRLEEARGQLEQALAEARRADDFETQGWVHLQFAILANLGWGDGEFALDHARADFELAERAGGAFSRVWANYGLGLAHARRAEWAQSSEALERALALIREHQTVLEGEAALRAHLARAQLARSEARKARATAGEAVRVALERGLRPWEGLARFRLGQAILATDGVAAEAEIRSQLQRSLDLLEETCMRSYEPEVHVVLAELEHAAGDDTAAGRERRAARQLCKEIGATPEAIELAGTIA